ncbi:MAG: alpha/beta hydrolase [Deltaproteobacteria bacterium]|nr:MAG: alpha/beta hydrolase [Deltaproteobacteria bacterium]
MFSTSILAGAAAALLPSAARSQNSVKARNVVLVHGAYADGSSWLEVIPYLQAAGMKATAVLAATKRILALQDGPTVLVGHSWAGTVISQAGVDPKVSALVYVAARAPDAGEDYGALAAKFPKPPASTGLVESHGYAQLNEEAFVKYFAGDIDPVKARALYAVQGGISSTLFASRTTVAAWKSKPTFYAISKQDKTTSPELERFLADRMKAKTIEVDASHVSLISKPKEIADLILLAAGDGA